MNKKSKRKILYIITKSVWAGASKYVYDLSTNLPREDFEVLVAAGGYNEMAQKISSAGIPYFRIKNFQRDVNFIKDILAFLEILTLIFKTKPDIIHTSSPKAGGITGVAILIYKIFKQKILSVYTAHGWAFNEKRPRWQIFLIKLFSKLTCLFYNKIICVSKSDYESAIKNKIAPAKKLVIIHNGIKPEDYNFLPREEARKELEKITGAHLSDSEIIIGTIGEFTKNKGQEYLIEAISNIKCIIIGFGEEYNNLKLKIKNLKFEGQVFLIENLKNAPNYLKAFDIFILPSLKEGLPYVLLEAGLAKLPVIATRVGGVPEIIENEKTGILIEPQNSQAIAENIKKLINSPELRTKLSENLYQKIINDFSFEKMHQKTIQAYNH